MCNSKQIPDHFLTSNDAAKYLGAGEPTLRNSRVTGKLFGIPAPAFVKLGRAVRYKRSTLENWVANCEEIIFTE